MRDVGQQLFFSLEQALNALGHLIESPRDLAHLVVARQLAARAQITLSQRNSHLRQAREWLRYPARRRERTDAEHDERQNRRQDEGQRTGALVFEAGEEQAFFAV